MEDGRVVKLVKNFGAVGYLRLINPHLKDTCHVPCFLSKLGQGVRDRSKVLMKITLW